MNPLLIIILSLFFAAFFLGMEIAFISSNKLRFELDRKQGKFSSGIINIFMQHPGQYLSTMLVGYAIALVIYAIAFTLWAMPIMEIMIPSVFPAMVIMLIIAALIFFLIAEYLPKVLFQVNPNISLSVCAVPLLLLYVLLYPVTKIINGIASFFIRTFTKITPGKNNPDQVFGKTDIDNFISDVQPVSKEELDVEHEIKIFQNALDFSSVKIRDCMIPRTDIVAVEESSPIPELKQKFIDTGVSKIIVYNEDIDNIIGYVHSKELFKNPTSIQSMLNQLTFVPETMSGNKMMQLFMQ